MAVPTCFHCKSSMFETAEFTPQGSKHKFLSIHCSMCGSIASILDLQSSGRQLNYLTEVVESIRTKVDNLALRGSA